MCEGDDTDDTNHADSNDDDGHKELIKREGRDDFTSPPRTYLEAWQPLRNRGAEEA